MVCVQSSVAYFCHYVSTVHLCAGIVHSFSPLLCDIPLCNASRSSPSERGLGHFQYFANTKECGYQLSRMWLSVHLPKFPWVELLVLMCMYVTRVLFLHNWTHRPVCLSLMSSWWWPHPVHIWISIGAWMRLSLEDPLTYLNTVSIVSLFRFPLDKAMTRIRPNKDIKLRPKWPPL